MNGEFVAWEDAKVHVLTHGLHYGTGVFEGVRCYDTESLGPAVFRHADHVDRLFKSAELYYMPIPFDREQLRQATLELIGRNGMRSCYIRPIVYRGYGTMGLFPLDAPVDVSIAVWEWGSYLGDEGKRNGVRAKVSWRRISPDSLIPQAKATGQYLNSILAKVESHKAGYEEAILLDDHGYVCEGTGENLFVVRDGVIHTPPTSTSILDGINRKSVIQIARDLGFEVVERNIARAELYLCDELYCTGTAAELTPIREVDDHKVGDGRPGEITRAVQQAFEDALHGRSERYRDWLDPVPAEHYSAQPAHAAS
jgi:branched-chain amino acid aminotransferase